MKQPTHVYAYTRVSGQTQVEKGGLPRQRDTILKFARGKKMIVEQEFSDEGISGEVDWDMRPAFSAMVNAISDGEVRTVIVENLTRLARSFVVQESILIYLSSKGVSLISADTGEDVTEDLKNDPAKRALIQMQGVFSEFEKNTMVMRLRYARQRTKQETGRCEGRKPFGFYPGETEIITRMRELRSGVRSQRKSYRKVAAALDAEGLHTRSGVPWSAPGVRKILEYGQPRSTPIRSRRRATAPTPVVVDPDDSV